MYVILLSCVALILQILPPVASSLGSITREEGQDVVFMFDTRSTVLQVSWGIREGDNSKFKLVLVVVDTIQHVQLTASLMINSSRYAGRVSFVGDLSLGQAWFKIRNLNINDTNVYLVKILTVPASAGHKYAAVQLTVVTPQPTTRPLQTSTTSSTSVVSSNTSSSAPRNTTSVKPSRTSVIATCVTVILILVVLIVVLLVYIRKIKEKSAKDGLSSNKGAEDLGAYENANQIDYASNTRVQEAAKPRHWEKELYETIGENRDEGANTLPTHPGVGTTRDPSASGPVPSMPQHYQELTNLPKNQQMPFYEALNQRNTDHSTGVADNPRTYEQLQQNVTGREYQSLHIIPNKEESKV